MMNKQEIENLVANNSIRMTNRQWLESLSDDELSKAMVLEPCRSIEPENKPCNNSTCTKCVRYWLRAEHKE